MAGPLKRRLGPILLTSYGIGVMVGAGIYVLVGVVIGQAGTFAPLAFLLAGLIALPSALAYSELATRMPEAAGETAFIERAYKSTPLAVVCGLAIVAAGVVSGAAVLRGGVGYLQDLVAINPSVLVIAIGVVLAAIAIVGVFESLLFAAILTAIEVVGLLIVAGAGFWAPAAADWVTPTTAGWSGVAAAVSLCFFAFIGFENIENMAEEVRAPHRNLPLSIIAALVITSALYGLVAWSAARAVPHAELAGSHRPLALMWERTTGSSSVFMSAIAVAAAVNGVLAQIVMAARVLYGLGRRADWLAGFTTTHGRYGTPVAATVAAGTAVIGAALALPVVLLAEITSGVLLVIFMLVNGALILLHRRTPDAPFRVPGVVPWIGLASAALGFSALIGELQ